MHSPLYVQCPICKRPLAGNYRVAGIHTIDGSCVCVHYYGATEPGECWERRGELSQTVRTVIGPDKITREVMR